MSGAIHLPPYTPSCPEQGKFPFFPLKQGLVLLLPRVERKYRYSTQDKLLFQVTVLCARIWGRRHDSRLSLWCK